MLRKWLSYREHKLWGRPLLPAEARQFTSIVRRLTELALLGPELDRNYRLATGAVEQEPLLDLAAVEP